MDDWMSHLRQIKHLSSVGLQLITAGILHLHLNMGINNTCETCEHRDIWRSEKSLTITSLQWALVIFLPSYVWMYSIRSHSHWNMLLHSEWVNLYVTASRVGSSLDGEPCLICLWLQRGLRHASCPCSALINGSGEREEGEKVCVRPRQRLWGFSQLNYIKRQSPADTHIHTHSANKYGYAHTHVR